MSLGTALFLSSILISLVLLYGFTKDRWRWKRLLATVLGILVVGMIGLTGVFLYLNQRESPTRLTKLSGVALGEKENDVIFRKGEPTKACNTDKGGKELWYRVSESWAQILIGSGTGVNAIAFFGDLSLAEQIQPLRIHSRQSVASVITEWGEPDKMVEGKSRTSRAYYWDRFNFIVAFEKDSAVALVVRDVSQTSGLTERRVENPCVDR